jgi:hypothetical protein
VQSSNEVMMIFASQLFLVWDQLHPDAATEMLGMQTCDEVRPALLA